ncbi:endolytic transglycosylase MltG [Pseudoruegeria sp. SHC-113]|uniref:endolytic transglycosylase MltG n=1 Tax=Pseudoruegeria sp. SHC-113 TaxID=2855439 RepID=UPI0021BBAC7F|nr:endolytic transglycosylase MltG [Pseudoruegeria sp. SHC-113]MCT8160112.1 endolytic transglycosylase MltG [Pseudoruegeria sp. SHC-113]
MWRSIASNALTLGIVAGLGIAAVLGWAHSQYRGPGPLGEAICLRVESGSNFSRVSESLLADGAISNGLIFRVGADYEDKTQDLKAGSFLVPEGTSMEEIVDIVTRGGQSTCGTEVVYRIGVVSSQLQLRELDPATNAYEMTTAFDPKVDEAPEAYTEARADGDVRYRIAMAEGVTSWQVVDALNAIDFLEGEVTEIPAEGMLAPDSYEVRPGTDRNVVLARMEEKQALILAEAWANRDTGLPISTPEEALVLASIIEKETGVPEERGQVASVFTNRLNQGMRLQTDPTVIYGITNGQGTLGRGLRQSELRAATPYNTYVIEGLPPTPIANPGRASIEAAVSPESTDLLFFVADGTGGHAFARTLEEHNRNVAEWRKIEAERANQ